MNYKESKLIIISGVVSALVSQIIVALSFSDMQYRIMISLGTPELINIILAGIFYLVIVIIIATLIFLGVEFISKKILNF